MNSLFLFVIAYIPKSIHLTIVILFSFKNIKNLPKFSFSLSLMALNWKQKSTRNSSACCHKEENTYLTTQFTLNSVQSIARICKCIYKPGGNVEFFTINNDKFASRSFYACIHTHKTKQKKLCKIVYLFFYVFMCTVRWKRNENLINQSKIPWITESEIRWIFFL